MKQNHIAAANDAAIGRKHPANTYLIYNGSFSWNKYIISYFMEDGRHHKNFTTKADANKFCAILQSKNFLPLYAVNF